MKQAQGNQMVNENGNEKANVFKARISRHLLFNALNAAVALCRRSPKEASKLIIELSECLLYTSDEKTGFVSLQDELEFIRSYLYIQSVRYGKRLQVEYHIECEPQGRIPQYAVYSVLEDMFRNKLMKTRANVTITIVVSCLDGEIAVTVMDSEGTSETIYTTNQ